MPSVTVSLETTPARDAVAVFKDALAVPSYVLLVALTPVTVSGFGVMDAVVVGCDSE
jgi:hypothetical protein